MSADIQEEQKKHTEQTLKLDTVCPSGDSGERLKSVGNDYLKVRKQERTCN